MFCKILLSNIKLNLKALTTETSDLAHSDATALAGCFVGLPQNVYKISNYTVSKVSLRCAHSILSVTL